MIQPNREELAWAAGFFDGEGCAYVAHYPNRDYPGVSISQVDPAVLHRFQRAVFGIGSVRGPRKPAPGGRPWWQWQVKGYESTQAIFAALGAFLSPVKVEQFKNVLEKARLYKGTRGTLFCSKGHNDWYYRPSRKVRHCRTCKRATDKNYWETRGRPRRAKKDAGFSDSLLKRSRPVRG